MEVRVEELLMHRSWLKRLARGLVHSSDAADDLVQETYLAALHGAGPGQPGSLRGWLAGVLRNRARMRARGEARRRAREQLFEDRERPDTSPERVVQRLQDAKQLAHAVMGLPEPLRSTVLLRYFEGVSAAEIARREQIPAGTVRWRLSRALGLLRDELATTGGAGEPGRPNALNSLAPVVGAPMWQQWTVVAQAGSGVPATTGWLAWLLSGLLVAASAVVVVGATFAIVRAWSIGALGDPVEPAPALAQALLTEPEPVEPPDASWLADSPADDHLYVQVTEQVTEQMIELGDRPISDAAIYADEHLLGHSDEAGTLIARLDSESLEQGGGLLRVEAAGYRPSTTDFVAGQAVEVQLTPISADPASPPLPAMVGDRPGIGAPAGPGAGAERPSAAAVPMDENRPESCPDGLPCHAPEPARVPIAVVACTHQLAYSPGLAHLIRSQRDMSHSSRTAAPKLLGIAALTGFVMVNMAGCELIYGDAPERDALCVTDQNSDGTTCVTCTGSDGAVSSTCDSTPGGGDCTTEIGADGTICLTCTTASGNTETSCGEPSPDECTTEVDADGSVCVTCIDAAGNSTTTCDGTGAGAQCEAELSASGTYCVVCTDAAGIVETVCEDGMQCTSDVQADGTVCINCAGTATEPPTVTCSNTGGNTGTCTTETQADGTVCETCTNADGTVTTTCNDPGTGDCTTETQADGTVCETCIDADGTSTTTCTGTGVGDCTTETQADGTVCETCIDAAGNSTTTCTAPTPGDCVTETQPDGTVCEICTAADGTQTTTCTSP